MSTRKQLDDMFRELGLTDEPVKPQPLTSEPISGEEIRKKLKALDEAMEELGLDHDEQIDKEG